MTANRSLDEFAGAASGVETSAEPSEAEAPEEPVEGSPPEATDAADAADVDPVASTYRWSPDGGPCAACGSTVEERWRQGDDLVCPACKEW